MRAELLSLFFFFNDTATTEIYTLSLHDALPISQLERDGKVVHARDYAISRAEVIRFLDRLRETPLEARRQIAGLNPRRADIIDRKSTRLNSSHLVISYAVFCLKKKKQYSTTTAH